MRRASSNSEFLFNSNCPRTAEVLAGESRNTRDRGGLQSEGLDPSPRSWDTSFIGGILLVLSNEVLLVIIFKASPASAAHEMESFRSPQLGCSASILVNEPSPESGWVSEEKRRVPRAWRLCDANVLSPQRVNRNRNICLFWLREAL
jgi:hypothetical protein